jgi:hypothetical protein
MNHEHFAVLEKRRVCGFTFWRAMCASCSTTGRWRFTRSAALDDCDAMGPEE